MRNCPILRTNSTDRFREMRMKGGGGVKKSQNFADVLKVWPLSLNQGISHHICHVEIFIIFKGQTSNSALRNIVDRFPLVATHARAGSLELLAAAPLLLGASLYDIHKTLYLDPNLYVGKNLICFCVGCRRLRETQLRQKSVRHHISFFANVVYGGPLRSLRAHSAP